MLTSTRLAASSLFVIRRGGGVRKAEREREKEEEKKSYLPASMKPFMCLSAAVAASG